jgi:hypothetical protein
MTTTRDRLSINQQIAFERNKSVVSCRIPNRFKYHLAEKCYGMSNHIKINGWRGIEAVDITEVTFYTHSITVYHSPSREQEALERDIEHFDSAVEMFAYVKGYMKHVEDIEHLKFTNNNKTGE